jgi:hypothetical protein
VGYGVGKSADYFCLNFCGIHFFKLGGPRNYFCFVFGLKIFDLKTTGCVVTGASVTGVSVTGASVTGASVGSSLPV